ncbi:hypothetical protein AOLI_G00046460 [Acnodon oligacanthus]
MSQVENVARFMCYMDPKRPSLLFVRQHEQTQVFQEAEARLCGQTVQNSMKCQSEVYGCCFMLGAQASTVKSSRTARTTSCGGGEGGLKRVKEHKISATRVGAFALSQEEEMVSDAKGNIRWTDGLLSATKMILKSMVAVFSHCRECVTSSDSRWGCTQAVSPYIADMNATVMTTELFGWWLPSEDDGS